MRFPRSLILTLSLSLVLSSSLLADDWPQWLGPQRDSVWRETGILKIFPTNGPTIRWRTPVGGGYAGPAVANGRVYITDRQLASGAHNPNDPFQRGSIPGSERILCLDASTGKTLWQNEYETAYTISYASGPRTTPLVSGGKVYTLGAEGHLFCLNAKDGKRIWSRELKTDYNIPAPMWGFAASPLLDGDKLICVVGGTNTTAVAFHKDTGKELWRALTAKESGYCPPAIIQAGGKRQLIIWHPESVNSLDPETGKVYWSHPSNIKMGTNIPTPRQKDDLLYFTCFYNGSMAFQLDQNQPAAKLIWQSKKISEKDTSSLHCTMSTPFIEADHIYGVCSYGQLRCLKADTGERVWETLKATTPDEKEMRWANAFLVKNADRFFLFNEKGDLIIAQLTPEGYKEISRAHILEPTSTAAGRDVLWSHPAFANKSMYARNDKEIVCVNLAE